MVDSFNTPGQEQVEAGVAPEAGSSASGLGGFLSTTVGRLVVGGIVLVVVVAAIGAILIMFVLNQPGGDGGPVVVPATGTTSTASIESSPTERPADEFADTFVFRNIFKPTVKITVSSATDTEDTPDADADTTQIPADTLYLSSVSTVDGESIANLVWDGANYALAEGDSIPGTPWQVLSISGDTVVMLYGDARVSLTVGQGISK